MYQFKKGAAAILAGVLSVSSVVPAFAAAPSDVENYDHVTTAGNKGNAAVMLTVEDREEPVIFSAYVPAELPIAIDVNGDVVVPENAKIINGVENLPIGVEAIDVTMGDGWTLASMSDDLASEAKDTKKVAMEVLGQDLSDADSFSPAKIEANGDIALNMKANLPDQSASSQTKIATIGFTVNWWEDESTPQPGDSSEFNVTKMRSVLQPLTGSITFSSEAYDPEQHTGTVTDISEAQDGSVMAVVNGQNAVVYAKGGALVPDVHATQNSEGVFASFKASSMDLSGLNTSQMTDMSYMFDECMTLETINFANFDTSNVVKMEKMFGNSQVSNLDLSTFDTSKVTNMEYMFFGGDFDTIDLSSFDTSNVQSMNHMFHNVEVTSLDLTSFDTSNVTDMGYMFGWTNIRYLDLSSFDTSNVTDMARMFEVFGGSNLDVTMFDTSKVTDMQYMFVNLNLYSGNMTSVDVSSFDMSSVTNADGMFDGCNHLQTIYYRNYSDMLKIKNGLSNYNKDRYTFEQG